MPGHEFVGHISYKALYEIAKIKKKEDPNLKDRSLEGVTKGLLGTARSMGIEVCHDYIKPKSKYIHVRKIGGKLKS